MVVAFHADGLVSSDKYWSARLFGDWLHPAGKVGVFFFFVLSGFIILHSHRKDMGAPTRIGEYAYKRATRIYPVYWSVAVPLMILGLVGVPIFTNPLYNEPGFILGLVTLIPFHGADGNLAVAWTLFYEIAFYAFFASLVLSRTIGIACLGAWFTAALFAAINGWNNVLASHLNLLFLFGMTASIANTRAVSGGVAPLIIGIGVFISIWAALVFGSEDARTPGTVATLGIGASAALIIFGLSSLERGGTKFQSRLFGLLGDASYSIYLVHYPLISLAAKIMIRINAPAEVAFPAVVVMSILGGVALHYVVEKPMLAFFRAKITTRQPLAAV